MTVHAAKDDVLPVNTDGNAPNDIMCVHINTPHDTEEHQPQPQPQPPLTAQVSLYMLKPYKGPQHTNKNTTVLDTGATRTMTPCIAFFVNKKLQHKPHKPHTPIQLGDGSIGPLAQ